MNRLARKRRTGLRLPTTAGGIAMSAKEEAMRSIWWRAALVLVVGIGSTSAGGKASVTASQGPEASAPVSARDEKKEHDHSDWWCAEHGVPEEICSQCDAKVATACKKKGDWCKEHDRADSQCFRCHPKLKAKYAAQYRAKYGKEPPPTADDAEEAKKKAK